MNTQSLIANTSGKNKAFLSRVNKEQEEKYGNTDIFDCRVYDQDDIAIWFGDSQIRFFFDDNGEVVDTTGNGQGHRYQDSLENVAKEIRTKYINDTLV